MKKTRKLNLLKEAEGVEAAKFRQTPKEKEWQDKIENVLRNSGCPEFADRFSDFALIIDKNTPTASVSWNTGKIRINPGLLEIADQKKMEEQLSVVIRHEMAHNLLLHEVNTIRYFQKKYPGGIGKKLAKSGSFAYLCNVIEDFEISNIAYSEEDKEHMRSLQIGADIINALVTEDHRDWAELHLADMYDAMTEEIDRLEEEILNNWDSTEKHSAGNMMDVISGSYDSAVRGYRDAKAPTNIMGGTIDDFINGKAVYHMIPLDRAQGQIALAKWDNLPADWQKMVKNITDGLSHSEAKKTDIRALIEDIAKSKISQSVDIISPITGEVLSIADTPEEKSLAADVLKSIIPTLELYDTWVEKVKRVLSDPKYSKEDLQKIADRLNK